ncbi:hypothetical protein [Oceanotoga phage vB_OteS-UFV02]
MRVKNLINMLSNLNPEADVYVGVYNMIEDEIDTEELGGIITEKGDITLIGDYLLELLNDNEVEWDGKIDSIIKEEE